MSTSRVSNSSPLLALNRKDEKDKDSSAPAQPMKKLKQSVTSLSDEEIFDKWCKCMRVTYENEKEKKKRFKIFKTHLKPPVKNEKDLPYPNLPDLADRSEEELNKLPFNGGCYAYIFECLIERFDEIDEYITKYEKDKDSSAQQMKKLKQSDEKDKDSSAPAQPMKKLKQSVTSLSDEEIFDKWCKCMRVTYENEKEKKKRFKIFKTHLKPPVKNEKDLPYPNLPDLADRSEEELNKLPFNGGCYAYIFECLIERFDEIDEYITKYEKDKDSSAQQMKKLKQSDEKDKDSSAPAQPMKKLKQSVTSLSDEEIFDKWCKCMGVTYENEKEKKKRFKIFKTHLKPPVKNEKDLPYPNLPDLADRSEEELNKLPPFNGCCYAYIFECHIERFDEIDEYMTKCEELPE